jgi:hypothetical protein
MRVNSYQAYWVIRGEQKWHIYRKGMLLAAAAPSEAKAFLQQLQGLGCIVVFGD